MDEANPAEVRAGKKVAILIHPVYNYIQQSGLLHIRTVKISARRQPARLVARLLKVTLIGEKMNVWIVLLSSLKN